MLLLLGDGLAANQRGQQGRVVLKYKVSELGISMVLHGLSQERVLEAFGAFLQLF